MWDWVNFSPLGRVVWTGRCGPENFVTPEIRSDHGTAAEETDSVFELVA